MSKIKTIIVVVVILAIGFFAYSYFFVSNNDTSANLKDVSGASSSSDATGTSTSPTKDLSQNDQYVKQLIALRAITFNFDLFSDDAYKILHAANTDIPPVDKGRHNPFAPLEEGDGNYTIATTTPTSTTTSLGFQVTSSTTPKTPVTPAAFKPAVRK